MGYHLLSLFNASAILLISFKHCFLSNIAFFSNIAANFAGIAQFGNV
jgi:hypothetical protein